MLGSHLHDWPRSTSGAIHCCHPPPPLMQSRRQNSWCNSWLMLVIAVMIHVLYCQEWREWSNTGYPIKDIIGLIQEWSEWVTTGTLPGLYRHWLSWLCWNRVIEPNQNRRFSHEKNRQARDSHFSNLTMDRKVIAVWGGMREKVMIRLLMHCIALH